MCTIHTLESNQQARKKNAIVLHKYLLNVLHENEILN